MSRTVLLLALLLAATPTARALAWSDAPMTPEGWAWAQIRAGRVADFNARCSKVDPHSAAGWDDPCRQVVAEFVVDALTLPKMGALVGRRHGVRLRGAHIVGDLDLINTEIDAEVWLEASRIEGLLDLSDAHLKHLLSLEGSVLSGDFDAGRLRVDGGLFMGRGASFAGHVDLRGAMVGDYVDMETANFFNKLFADGLRVEGSLFMRDGALHGEVLLRGAAVGGNLIMDRSTFSDELDLSSAQVHGSLFMRDGALHGEVLLRGAAVGGNLEMETATFSKALSAAGLRVQNNLFMRHASFAGGVDLSGATVGGNLEMEQSSFGERLEADRLDVQGLAFLRRASFEGDVKMADAKVHVLDMQSASAASVDLSGVTGDQLLLAGLSWHCSPQPQAGSGPADASKPKQWPLGDPDWRTEQCGGGVQLNLHNTFFHRVIDSRDAWPAAMDLAGFQYEEFSELPTRPATEWADWLARDRASDPRSYAKLAAALAAAGRESTAEAIQFAQRERERDEAWVHNDWRTWLGLTAQGLFYGYGIRFYYASRVLWWAAFLTALGAIVLWFSPYARERGVLWQLGASLHRLLPIVQLDKEFKDFFDNASDNTAPRKLTRWQWGFFCLFALAGWVIAALLAAIVGGLTSK